ncbi:PREDICTED: uncharacterized protein LOC104752070 [Camelina sativa]|uniref:Uncharacterized protein LOC104752070 n=1 Tax=Camelina sativa TaxID=90675 RepID=A0ABM0WKM3_CAMSA|nr:PREDICTED: uncharacterized protein LOC104752070 [Camelina sativa]
MDNSEKVGGPRQPESSFYHFRTLARDCRIKEIPSTGNHFSWGGRRENVWVQCRLDHSFGNSGWFDLFPRVNTEYLDLLGSDHRPIITRLVDADSRFRGRFMFDKRWINKPDTEKIIREQWEAGNRMTSSLVMASLSQCRRALSRWKKTHMTNSASQIQLLRKDLEFESTKTHPNFRRLQQIKWALNVAFREEEVYWKTKSRETWLQIGDKNTAYFHGSVKYKRLKNRLVSLIDKNGVECFEEGSKGDIAAEYFSQLFQTSNPTGIEDLLEGMEPRVSEDMNVRLTAPVSAQEIKQAAFNIKGDSAPGADGWTGAFFRKYWHIVGADNIAEVQGFFQTGVMPQGWNHTQLCLIPKKPNANQMSDMRPISLCSVLYKIVSKVLCSRLTRCLPDLVSETQGAFVAGRLISDNILIAHEIVHALKTNVKFDEHFIAVKTDMSKAYDRVEWDFLEKLFIKMGFAVKWVQWIMMCVRSVSFSVLINGCDFGLIKPGRGIRQGDPLSPFLFILCAEALVYALQRSHQQERLTGFRFNESCPVIQNLLFADDSLFVCQSTKEECEELMLCLQSYGKASGQMINLSKSAVTFGKRISEETKNVVKQTLSIYEEGGTGTYLGLPECFSGSKQALLGFIGDKLQNRLQGWFAKSLSLGGKEVLLKAVAMALPVYAMSCFRLSKNLCRKLTSAMCEFWWSNCQGRRKIAWVAWKKLCKSKSEGGLGFKDLGDFNQALLAKQAWRILNNPDSLVTRFYKSRYFRKTSIIECGAGSRPSYAWRSILHGRDLLKAGLMKSIGDGCDTLVWRDKWIMDKHPRAPFRSQIFFDFNMKVVDLRTPGAATWDKEKTLSTLYEPRSDDLIKLNELKASVWKVETVPKIRTFLWRMLSGALAVSERLASRALALANIPSPIGGFSATNIDINWEHLLKVIQDEEIPSSVRELVFKAQEDATQWKEAQSRPVDITAQDPMKQGNVEKKWIKPMAGYVKCNIRSSWYNSSRLNGGAWILRDETGQVLYHARNALSPADSRFVAALQCLLWALDALRILHIDKVELALDNRMVIEAINCPSAWPRFSILLSNIHEKLSNFTSWRASAVAVSANTVAVAIAKSVTRDGRLQSYLSLGGPSWLHNQVRHEAI